jgi:DNA-binding MarR family transcriptional regulator
MAQSDKAKRTLSERLRDRFATDAPTALDAEEREKIRALADEIGQRQFSTIARVMGEGRGRSGAPSRGSAAIHRILEEIEERPGLDVHELARQLGEKSIFVLSHVDDLVREGMLVRLEDGRLYRSRDLYQTEPGGAPAAEPASPDAGQRAVEQREQARLYLRAFRFFCREIGLEPECGEKLTVTLAKGKFFEMKGMRGVANLSLYGIYPGDMVDRFRQTIKFDRARVTYSRLTGILDIRGCSMPDLECMLPWILEFFQVVSRNGVSAE